MVFAESFFQVFQITHLTAEGDLRGYGELLGLLNALLVDNENTPEIDL